MQTHYAYTSVMTIRSAQPDDVPALVTLCKTVWVDTYAAAGLPSAWAAWVEQKFAPSNMQQQVDNALVLVAASAQGLCGVVIADSASAEIKTLYVQRHSQGHGIGRRLLAAVFAQLGPRSWLATWQGNLAAIRFYRRLGWREDGTTPFVLDGVAYQNIIFRAPEVQAESISTAQSEVQLLRLRLSDAPAYRALMLDAYASFPEAFTALPEERAHLPLTWWAKRLIEGPKPNQMVFGYFENEVLAGVAGLSFGTRPKHRHKAHIFGMYVAEAYQRKGVGEKLLTRALEAACQRSGTRIVTLTVTEGNHAALQLYQRAGFTAFGTEPMAIAHGDRFLAKVHMWKRV